MITQGETANIMFRDCAVFGIPVYQSLNTPVAAEGERIIVAAKPQTRSERWLKNYIEVNILVPDLEDGRADLVRLQEREREAIRSLNSCGRYDGTAYRYSVDSTQIMERKDSRCHYVNVRVMFQTLNIINQ